MNGEEFKKVMAEMRGARFKLMYDMCRIKYDSELLEGLLSAPLKALNKDYHDAMKREILIRCLG